MVFYIHFLSKIFFMIKMDLKLVSAIFYHFFVFSPNDSPLKTTKIVFYFI